MTRRFILLLPLLVGACSPREGPSQGWSDSLKVELLQRLARDQEVRDRVSSAMRDGSTPDIAVIHEMQEVDSANTAWLREVVARHGWPGIDAIGEDGARAAFLLVQHADQDTAFQAAMLPHLVAAYRRGQAKGQSVALLTDRLAVARGELQVYGSQVNFADGRPIVAPIRDSAGVDARRAEMGLPPLREYLRVIDSVYFGPRRE